MKRQPCLRTFCSFYSMVSAQGMRRVAQVRAPTLSGSEVLAGARRSLRRRMMVGGKRAKRLVEALQNFAPCGPVSRRADDGMEPDGSAAAVATLACVAPL
jgi:hypothetical protein